MSKKKILLFGATGMAGHLVYLFLKETGSYEMKSVVYRNKLSADDVIMDVSNKDEVIHIISIEKPDYIINCIGILIKGANDYPDNAIYLNAYFPHLLARIADEVGIKLIHISTDCVFSGKKGGYSETDLRDADDVYGRSKALGEIDTVNHLTLRTSIIGPEIKKAGEGLFHWFMTQSGEIKGFTEAYWSGVTTLELAKAIDKAIANQLKGLLHITNGEKISKFSLVNFFKSIWNKEEIEITAYPGKTVDKSLTRSVHFDFEVPSYEAMLLAQKGWMDDHLELYKSIYF